MAAEPFATAPEAETAFYAAFEAADVEAMMAVWAPDADIVCVHPVGQRLTGHAAVRESWETLFSHSQTLHFQIGDALLRQLPELAVHVVHEHITIGDSDKLHPPVLATNIYRLTDNGWHMVLHHASPTPGAAQSISAVH